MGGGGGFMPTQTFADISPEMRGRLYGELGHVQNQAYASMNAAQDARTNMATQFQAPSLQANFQAPQLSTQFQAPQMTGELDALSQRFLAQNQQAGQRQLAARQQEINQNVSGPAASILSQQAANQQILQNNPVRLQLLAAQQGRQVQQGQLNQQAQALTNQALQAQAAGYNQQLGLNNQAALAQSQAYNNMLQLGNNSRLQQAQLANMGLQSALANMGAAGGFASLTSPIKQLEANGAAPQTLPSGPQAANTWDPSTNRPPPGYSYVFQPGGGSYFVDSVGNRMPVPQGYKHLE